MSWLCPATNIAPSGVLCAQTIKPDFSNFDETAAWPYLLDEFVTHMKEKRA